MGRKKKESITCMNGIKTKDGMITEAIVPGRTIHSVVGLLEGGKRELSVGREMDRYWVSVNKNAFKSSVHTVLSCMYQAICTLPSSQPSQERTRCLQHSGGQRAGDLAQRSPMHVTLTLHTLQ